MSDRSCILTTKDLMVLKTLLGRCRNSDQALVPHLIRKLRSANVIVLRDNVPQNVATLNSRVSFSVNGTEFDARVLALEEGELPVGLGLPITTPRGLALLGLTVGQGYSTTGYSAAEEHIQLVKVLYQPEAARCRTETARYPVPGVSAPSPASSGAVGKQRWLMSDASAPRQSASSFGARSP